MFIRGRILRVGPVWLMALLTLAAASPQLHCRCPDGRFKPFCLAFLFPQNNCCTQPCCPALPVEPVCCCCDEARAAPDTGARLESTSCERTVAQRGALAETHARTTAAADRTALPFGLIPSVPLVSSPAAAADPRGWQAHLLAPPTDRVILFCHFLL